MCDFYFLKGEGLSGSSCSIQWTMVCRPTASLWILSCDKVENCYMWWVT